MQWVVGVAQSCAFSSAFGLHHGKDHGKRHMRRRGASEPGTAIARFLFDAGGRGDQRVHTHANAGGGELEEVKVQVRPTGLMKSVFPGRG